MSGLTGQLLSWVASVEQWEADLLATDDAWRGNDGLPRFTQGLYDRWLELQAERNRLLTLGRKEATK